MAFTKIQPQQVQLATFLSHSGHLTFTDLTTGVEVYINELLSGDFNFTGSLKFEDADVLASNATNNHSGSAKVLGGSNNDATGSNHVIINGDNNEIISGDYNTILVGRSCSFGRSGQYNTIVGGRSASFGDKVTGSMIIADQVTASQTINKNHSLLVSFDSGIDFKAPNSGINFYPNTVMRSDLDVIQDLTVEGDFSATEGYSNFSYAEFADVISGTSADFSEESYFRDVLSGTTGRFESLVSGVSGIFSNHLSGLDGVMSGILSGNSGDFQNTLVVSGALSGSTADFTGAVTLKDDSEAASYNWITGGINNSEGFVQAVAPESPTAGAGTITIPVSGFLFRVDGTWL